jgi:predicted dehydrogenase
MIQKIKIGIIGIGKMGNNHAKTILNHPECELIGFIDYNPQAIFHALNTYKNTIEFDSISEMATKCDAVFICLPASLHFKFLNLLIPLQVHIFCEKPSVEGFMNYRFIQSLIDFVDYKGIIHIGQVEKFNPIVKYVKNSVPIADKFLIATFSRQSNNRRNEDVSVIYDTMVHDIDLAYHLFPNIGKLESFKFFDVKSELQYIYAVKVKCYFENGNITFNADKRNLYQERTINFTNNGFYDMDLKDVKLYKNNYLQPLDLLITKDQLTEQLDCFIDACKNKVFTKGTTFTENKRVIELASYLEDKAQNYLINLPLKNEL